MSNAGKTVKVHYVGTLDDGTQFDSSRDRGEPLEFVCMNNQMIEGFDEAVRDMEVGQTVNVHIPCEKAYGPSDPGMIHRIQFEALPGSERLEIGSHPLLATPSGRPIPCVVIDKDEETFTIDMNHELAGKDLNFEIELLEAK